MSEMQDQGVLVVIEPGTESTPIKRMNYVLVERTRGWIHLYDLGRQQVIGYSSDTARDIAQSLIEAADIADAAKAVPEIA